MEKQQESLYRIIGFIALIPIAFFFTKIGRVTNYFADLFGITTNVQIFEDVLLAIFIVISGLTVYFVGKYASKGRPILQKVFGLLLGIHYLAGLVFVFYILIIFFNSNY